MVIDEPPGAEVADIPLEQIPEQFRPLVAAVTDPESLMNRAFGLSVPDIDFNSPEAQAAGDPPPATGSARRTAWPGSMPP